MIYLLYGPDTYRSRALLRNVINEFHKKTPAAGGAFFRFDAEEGSAEDFINVLRTRSLFNPKQLVILERPFTAKSQPAHILEPFLAEWQKSEELIFVFWDADVNTGLPVFQRFQKYASKIQAFPLLVGARLEQWLNSELAGRGLKVPFSVKRTLLADGKGDLWKVTRELNKYEVGGFASARRAVGETKIWDFTDRFFEDTARALALALRLFFQGFDPLYLGAALAKTVRAVALVGELPAAKRNSGTQEQTLRLHPFVVKKYAAIAAAVDKEFFWRTQACLLDLDINIKTGKLPASIALLNLFVGKES